MGNNRKGGKPRQKNQPLKLLLSGETGTIAIGGKSSGDNLDNSITIQLIQLNLGVAAQISAGDAVQLRWHDSQYEAYFDNQRLGNVPGSYNMSLLPQSRYKGHIIKVAIYGDPALVIVKVRLPNSKI